MEVGSVGEDGERSCLASGPSAGDDDEEEEEEDMEVGVILQGQGSIRLASFLKRASQVFQFFLHSDSHSLTAAPLTPSPLTGLLCPPH